MSSRARIYARNLLANWVGHAISLAVMFFLSPFIVTKLGTMDYGIWSVLVTLTGYLGVLDLGVRASSGRYIILYAGRGDAGLVNDTIRSGMGVFSLLGALAVAISVLLGWLFPDLFHIPVSYGNLFLFLLPLLAMNFWMTAVGTLFSSVLAAHDRFDLFQAMNLGVLALRTVGTVIALSCGYGLAGLALVLFACQLVALMGNYVLARRVFPEMQTWPPAITRDRFAELASYGIPAFISAVAYKVIYSSDTIVAGIMFPTATLAGIYSIGMSLPDYFWGFVEQINSTFFPPIQRAFAQNNMPYVHGLYIREARTSLFVGLPVYIGFFFFGGMFLQLWLAHTPYTVDDIRLAAKVLGVLCAARMVFLFCVGASPLLSAVGHIRFNAGLAVVEAIVNLGLSITLVKMGWGLVGIAAGTFISMLAVRGVLHPWYACRKTHLAERRYLLEAVAPGLLTGALFSLWCLGVRCICPRGAWWAFGLQVVLAMAGYLPVGMLLLVDPIDRRRVAGFLLGRLRGKRPAEDRPKGDGP